MLPLFVFFIKSLFFKKDIIFLTRIFIGITRYTNKILYKKRVGVKSILKIKLNIIKIIEIIFLKAQIYKLLMSNLYKIIPQTKAININHLNSKELKI